MLIRKNTKAFKTIEKLLTACQDRSDREQLIRLYITKAGDSIKDRISVDAIEGGAALFYEMTYQTVLNNLRSSNHQLQVSEEVQGVYYFHSSSNKVWDETPFEFDEAIKKEFAAMPELPVVRKKETTGKFSLPTPKEKKKPEADEKGKRKPAKVAKVAEKAPAQPRFSTRQDIEFTHLDKLIYRHAKVKKSDVLQYYSDIAEHLLPYLKDRRLHTRFQSESSRPPVELTTKALFSDEVGAAPRWIKMAPAEKAGNDGFLICNDKEHLLLYVERGCLEFIPSSARAKDSNSLDYLLIGIESPDSDITHALAVARNAREILDGLELPSFVKTDGAVGLHIYIPLTSGSDFQTTRSVAEYLCKLIRLKIPDVVTLKGSGGNTYGKVILEYSFNQMGAIAPYSLLAGQTPIVATPVAWEEVEEGFHPDNFTHESIFKRLKEKGDLFDGMFKKKVNANDLLERLQANYSFLF